MLLLLQRLAVLALSAPLFGLVALAMFADGLLTWYKRRTSVGRESGFIYHHAKHAFNYTLLAVWTLYLLPPMPLDPRWVIPPALVLVGLSLRLAVGYFQEIPLIVQHAMQYAMQHYLGLSEYHLRQKQQEYPVHYEPERLINAHLLVCGMSGTGKSYQSLHGC